MANNYVKFMRGTTSAYNNLKDKDVNTLYFLSDKDDEEGALYLGTKLIAGPDDCSGIHSLKDLSDVLITQDINYDAILMYDHTAQAWQDYSIDALIFSAGTETANGTAGFVPAPQAADTNKFLRGDGTWAIAGAECQIFDIQITGNQSHSSALALHTMDKILNKGDIAIIKDLIIDTKYQYTSYVYNGSDWCALDDKYNANNVYLSTDLVFKDRNNADQTLTVSGKNLKEAFELVLAKAETATLSDAKTLIFDNNILSLKDFGKRFYKYVPESGSVDEGTYEPAHYALQIVDQDNPWKSGLEPKVVSENGVLVLGWYEPNPTTIDGLNDLVTTLRNDVNNLTTATSNINSRLNNVYTIEETNAAIAAAEHLKRIKVDSVQDIDPTAAGAEQYIYMVSVADTGDNKYNEYMVIEGKVEPVGSWEVDLTDYATKQEVANTVDGINTKFTAVDNELARIDNKAEPNVIAEVDESFKIENKKLSLAAIPSTINLAENESLLEKFVQQDSTKDLVSTGEIEKLLTVEPNAEKNIIDSIDTAEFNITGDIERKLSINVVSGAKVNLQTNEDFKAVTLSITDINNNISTMSGKLSTTEAQLQTINNTLTNVNTALTNMDARLDAVESAITWVDL